MSVSEVPGTPSVASPSRPVSGSLTLVRSTGVAATAPSPSSRLPGDSGSAVPVLCHYCEMLPGSTIDHIVPRSLLPRVERMLGKVTENSVKACQHCNGRKGSLRVKCCERCLAAWARWGPADWETRVTVVSKLWVAKTARTLARQ